MQADIDQTGGFQYVEQRSTKKNRKRRNNAKNKTPAESVTRAPPDLGLHLETRRSAMEKSRWLTKASTWFAQCLKDPQALRPARRIVCLALGSFSPDSAAPHSVSGAGVAFCTGIQGLKKSQYQLVFLLDVILPILSTHQPSEELDRITDQESQTASPTDVPPTHNLMVSFYDPAFTERDKDNLRNLGHVVLDAEPSLRCEETTFFYMPHAPKTLYERLVCENCPSHGADNLSQVVLMGNDLKSYQKIMVQEEKECIPVLMRLDPGTIQALYPPDLTQLNQDTGVHFFNETCFQWFGKS